MQRYKICQQFTTRISSIYSVPLLFQICKDTKFVSNSQLLLPCSECSADCFRYAKIQNLSAIHNESAEIQYRLELFQICKDTKFVSNSQLSSMSVYDNMDCFRYAKIQNLSAIHNSMKRLDAVLQIVSDMQRYKICQQFTTSGVVVQRFA